MVLQVTAVWLGICRINVVRPYESLLVSDAETDPQQGDRLRRIVPVRSAGIGIRPESEPNYRHNLAAPTGTRY